MNESAMNAHPLFQPPVLSSRTARVLNVLLRATDDGGALAWPEPPVCLRVRPFPQPFTPVIRARLHWFGGICTVEVAGLDVARFHPLLKNLPADADIPEPLRLAVLDILVTAALDALGHLGGAPQSVEYGFVSEPEESMENAPCLWLELVMPDGTHFPVRVTLPEDDTPVQAMLSALQTAAPDPARAPTHSSASRISLSSLAVTASVETGAMRLSLAECRGLAVGDILLPDDYPARENRARLVFESRRPMPVLHCALHGRTATIEHLTLPPEASMSDSTPQEQPAESAPLETTHPEAPEAAEGVISVPDMDLVVSFELERRLLTVAEVAALRPGHTFTLTTDPLAPVTVRVQGKAIGTGRLVDLGGTLGVQITALS